jgi:hypothetical protein
VRSYKTSQLLHATCLICLCGFTIPSCEESSWQVAMLFPDFTELILAEHPAVYTNRTDDSALVALATHDTRGRGGLPKVLTLRDAFCDFIPLDRHLFTVASPFQSSAAPHSQPALGVPLGPLQRPVVEAITAVSAALRCSPVLRYQRGSKRAADVARAASDLVSVRSSTSNRSFLPRSA